MDLAGGTGPTFAPGRFRAGRGHWRTKATAFMALLPIARASPDQPAGGAAGVVFFGANGS